MAIMQDLQGPKIRAGKLGPDGIELHKGDMIVLHPEGTPPASLPAGARAVPVSAEIAAPVARDARVGARILFDDGKIATRATAIQGAEITAQVEVGGKLTNHKGMNLPGTPLTIPCLTDKDIEDLEFGIREGVDAVALSFVRSASRGHLGNSPAPIGASGGDQD